MGRKIFQAADRRAQQLGTCSPVSSRRDQNLFWWVGSQESPYPVRIGFQGAPERFEGGVVVTIADTDRMSVRSFTYDDTHQKSCDCETNEGAELTGPLSRGAKVR